MDDNWRQQQAGFRAGRERDLDSASITGNLYRGHAEQAAPGVVNIAGSKQELGAVRTGGANLTGRWLHTLADGGSLSLQAYADFSRRQVPPTFTESLDIMDLQFQHSLPQRGRHGVVWGVAPVGRVHGAA
ncbi:hypothetical protein [Massilia terrae]|uniref:TonB-dependent receptor n=1 Tax=Massilia terrae TaxID=1811224 RepID=A0ABT2D5C3_9BURK|nr:hypothetical protein [Massilia terrae]MCS0660966.1 hypothetical protein [Massilia terrae]